MEDVKKSDQMSDSRSKLKITLKPFDLPEDRHYVKVRNGVLKFNTKFCTGDGAALNRFVLCIELLYMLASSVTI